MPIWALTIENEPGAGFLKDYKWNSMGFNAEMERDFIKKDLGPELHNSHLEHVKIMIYDDQLPWLKDFAKTVLHDKEAAKYVSGIAMHWYWNDKGNRNDLDEIANEFKNVFILASEACLGLEKERDVWLGVWSGFNSYAGDIIQVEHFSIFKTFNNCSFLGFEPSHWWLG